MKKLIELWAEKKALCIGVIAGAVIVIAGGITTAVIIGSNHTGKETAVASEETSGHSKETDKNKKNNQTTQSVTEISTEVTESATEEVTDESKEDNTEEKENVKEVAADNDNTVEEKPGNVQSENTDSNNVSGNESSDNGENSNSNSGNNSTSEPVKPAEPVTQAPVVIHGKDGVILDELTINAKDGTIVELPKNVNELGGKKKFYWMTTENSIEEAMEDSIYLERSSKQDVVNRYGNPYEISENPEEGTQIYKYFYYKRIDDDQQVIVEYVFLDNVLKLIVVGSYIE